MSRCRDDQLAAFNVKQCPRCRHGIFRSGGCSHMSCSCGYYFCWDCLAPLDDNHNRERCMRIQVLDQSPYVAAAVSERLSGGGAVALDIVSATGLIDKQNRFMEELSSQLKEEDLGCANSPFFATLRAALSGSGVVLGIHMQSNGALEAKRKRSAGSATSPLARLGVLVEGMLDLAVAVKGDPAAAARHAEQLNAVLTKILAAAGKAADELRVININRIRQ
jgi:hypothetical protein